MPEAARRSTRRKTLSFAAKEAELRFQDIEGAVSPGSSEPSEEYFPTPSPATGQKTTVAHLDNFDSDSDSDQEPPRVVSTPPSSQKKRRSPNWAQKDLQNSPLPSKKQRKLHSSSAPTPGTPPDKVPRTKAGGVGRPRNPLDKPHLICDSPLINDKTLFSTGWQQDDYDAEYCVMSSKAQGTKDNWLVYWTRFGRYCTLESIAPTATLGNLISCLKWDVAEGPFSTTTAADPVRQLGQWLPAAQCLSKLQGYGVTTDNLKDANGYKHCHVRMGKMGHQNIHGMDRNTAKESIENKKMTEEDHVKLMDHAWTLSKPYKALRLMCHEGILEMTGNRGGECGFLRLEQMRLADTSELALHPDAFKVWQGDDSNIIRWSAWTKNQGSHEICRSMARRASPEYCSVAFLTNWLSYQLDINEGTDSYRGMMEDLTTNRHCWYETGGGDKIWIPAWVLVHIIPGCTVNDGLCRSGLLKNISTNMKAAGVAKKNKLHGFRYLGLNKTSAVGQAKVGLAEWEQQGKTAGSKTYIHACVNYDEVFIKSMWGALWRKFHNLGMDTVQTWEYILQEPWLESHPHLTGIAEHVRGTLFQGADAAKAAVEARLGKGEKDSALSVAEMFLYMRMVFLQNAVFLRPLHPQHPLFAQHPLFKNRLFEEWFMLVWTPCISRRRRDAEEALRLAREQPLGITQMRELLGEIHAAKPGSPEHERATQRIMDSLRKSTEEADRRLQQERRVAAGEPMPQPDFSMAAPAKPGPPQASFTPCNDIRLLWGELTLGREGSPPLLDRLDPRTFDLRRPMYTWAPAPGGKKPDFWKHQWGKVKPTLLDIFRRCDQQQRGAALRTQGMRLVEAVEKAMEGRTDSLELFGKKKGGESSDAWKAYLQLVACST
ncbi:hypothetical protein WJX74_006065 [Apatococcus lobatus]|uniref:Uncharacterized protein n=2 Tax=Apatococcus TaxID=904362 RepID=A0AAW1T7H4_9CHLO